MIFERRRYARINLSVKEKCYFEYWKPGRKKGFLNPSRCILTKNISGTGLMFLNPEYIEPNTVFDAEIRLPGGYKTIQCQVKVARCERDNSKKDLYQVGIQYIRIPTEDQLSVIHFCEKKFEDMKKRMQENRDTGLDYAEF
ncbi:MAG: PilZ domain-containing protein [bacterium]|nr:PilZ domain-containing protein [bacterium]